MSSMASPVAWARVALQLLRDRRGVLQRLGRLAQQPSAEDRHRREQRDDGPKQDERPALAHDPPALVLLDRQQLAALGLPVDLLHLGGELLRVARPVLPGPDDHRQEHDEQARHDQRGGDEHDDRARDASALQPALGLCLAAEALLQVDEGEAAGDHGRAQQDEAGDLRCGGVEPRHQQHLHGTAVVVAQAADRADRDADQRHQGDHGEQQHHDLAALLVRARAQPAVVVLQPFLVCDEDESDGRAA